MFFICVFSIAALLVFFIAARCSNATDEILKSSLFGVGSILGLIGAGLWIDSSTSGIQETQESAGNGVMKSTEESRDLNEAAASLTGLSLLFLSFASIISIAKPIIDLICVHH